MSKIHETGHAVNVAKFNQLIGFCKGYGAAYNPASAHLQILNLDISLAEYQNAISDVANKKRAFEIATNDRRDKFSPLKSLSTKIVNALDVLGTSDKNLEDARGINRKIQGNRAEPKAKITTTSTPQSEDEHKYISVSRQSYTQLTEHLSDLIILVQSEPLYTPNEPQLKVTSLNALLAEFKLANQQIIDTYTELNNSRIQRDKLFYLDVNCLYDTAMDVKKYVKTIFAVSSLEYKQVRGIKFKKF